MKVIIAGSRDWDYPELFAETMLQVSATYDITEIVSGGARGADRAGEIYALERGIPVKRFIPDWDIAGKAAGHIRNREMGDYADVLVAFWDGSSKGTKGMIEYMKRLGKPSVIVQVNS